MHPLQQPRQPPCGAQRGWGCRWGSRQPWKHGEAADTQLACCDPNRWRVTVAQMGVAQGPTASRAQGAAIVPAGHGPHPGGRPASPVRGSERHRERDEDGATDWQPAGKRRRRCQGTAWRAKAPREPGNSFGEKRGAGSGGVCSEAGGAGAMGGRGRGRGPAEDAASGRGGASRPEATAAAR